MVYNNRVINRKFLNKTSFNLLTNFDSIFSFCRVKQNLCHVNYIILFFCLASILYINMAQAKRF